MWSRKCKYVCCLILSAYFLSPPTLSAQTVPYKFKYLTVDEGLSHTDANDIVQDCRGYIWIATHFGLDRYDGYQTKQYYNNNDPIHNAFKNRITTICADDSGNLWLGTELGLQRFNPRTEQYTDLFEPGNQENTHFDKLYKPRGNLIYGLAGGRFNVFTLDGDTLRQHPISTPDGARFSDMATSPQGVLYFATSQGIWLLGKDNRFVQLHIRGLPSANLSTVSFDNQGNLLASAGNMVIRSARSSSAGPPNAASSYEVDRTFVVPNTTFIREILPDQAADYWINTGSAMHRLDKNLTPIQVVSDKSGMRSLNANSLKRAFIDRSQCLWICTFGGGVNFCDLNEKLFYTFQHDPESPNSLSGNHVRSVLEDGDDLWIGTTANGLNRYNRRSQTFSFYNTYNSPVRLKHNIAESLLLDKEKNLWIGGGLGIEILRPDRKTLWRPPGYETFPTYGVETLAQDCFGNIWFGDHRDRFGVIFKDASNRFHVKYYGESYFILADSVRPILFASSTHGLKRLTIDAGGNILKTVTYQATKGANSLSSSYTYPICKQNDSVYWVGTIGGGLNRLSLGATDDVYTIRSYTDKDGVFKDVESLEIDNTGDIWMGGNGLARLNPSTGKVTRYDRNDGLQGNSFKVGSSYKGSDGILYFGGINGLNYFYPDQIHTNSIDARPMLTDLIINNQRPEFASSGAADNTIPEAIGYEADLTLNYLQDHFVLSFSAMHFANPLKCRYRYKLVGFDKDWKYTDGKNPRAAYGNLDFRHYTFLVEATNNDGVWSSSRASARIDITPPWWKSPQARYIYWFLILAALAGIYLYQGRWYRLKRELEVRAVNEKKREEIHQQREELYQQQLTFFTNISHEFRTPLTLILGPLEALISQNKDTALDTSYQLMLRNARRLINLISELMNFRKVADSVIKLHVEPVAIYQFCKDIAGEFQNLADSKDIRFHIHQRTQMPDTAIPEAYADIQVLEKILFNLLNNAFKYTEMGGDVSLDIFYDLEHFHPMFASGIQLRYEEHRARKYLYFRIADTGIGISRESLAKIFDRYYRVSSSHLGSGVGLALVKSLTRLHKGDIYVYSERHQGTEIVIGIPWGEENYSASEKAPPTLTPETRLEVTDSSVLLPFSSPGDNSQAAPSSRRKQVLIVDDNQELRIFLRQAFEGQYQVYEAEDGRSALELAAAKVPDLIISDVMMPGMNGIELCKLLKERFETSHIPFIILSAKDALDSKLAGMSVGADFYFAKPLNVDLLRLTVHNIFEQSQKLKQHFAKNYLADATELVQSEKDKKFFEHLSSLIDANMDDPALDVDFLCERLLISRTRLYQKVQSTSGQSVAEFIRTIRLKKAIQIMTHEDVAMNEVADRVGMQSASNFSRAFKKEYGKSPLQFMQALRKRT